MARQNDSGTQAQRLSVACLCADWCQTCDGYRPIFEQIVGELVERGTAHPPRWIDIEDEEALIGDIDVETFPTLLVFNARHILFAGPLTPQPDTLRRMLRGLAESDAGTRFDDPAWIALADQLRRADD